MKNKRYLTLKYELILQKAINKQLRKKEQQMEYLITGLIFLGLATPYAIMKIYKRNKRWNKDDVKTIDNWKYPSNYM